MNKVEKMRADFPESLHESCKDNYFKLLDFLEAKRVKTCYIPAVEVKFCIVKSGCIIDMEFKIPVSELVNLPNLELKLKVELP